MTLNLLNRMPTFANCLTLMLAIVLMVAGVQAQSNYGSIQGSVQDKFGALVPNVTVTATALGTNESRQVQTNKQGEYDIEALPPVIYRIAFSAAGFQSVAVENVKVNTASNTIVNATLQVQTANQQVTVTAENPQLQSEDGTPSFTINQRSIQDMPLDARNTLSLALTLPGVSGNAGSEYGSQYNTTLIPGRELIINGGRPGTSQFVADGQSVTSVGLGRTTVSFSPDSIQEFTVLESNFSAQYSQAGGAIIQQSTRGGTNDLHGDVYWFYRTRGLQATPFDTYANATVGDARPPLQRNQLGAVAGGPVEIPKLYHGRNKTFFFASFEPTRQTQGNLTPSFERVPTTAERAGNFCNSLIYKSNGTTTPFAQLYNHFVKDSAGGLDYAPNPGYNASQSVSASNPEFQYNFASNMFDPNDSNPSCVGRELIDAGGANYINPVSAKLAALYEQPNLPSYIATGSNAGANYEYFRIGHAIDNRYSVRIDQVLPKNNTMFVRATIEPNSTDRFYRNQLTDPGVSSASNAKQILLSETGVIRQNMVNDIRIGYSGGDFASNFPSKYQTTDGTTPYLGTGGTPNVLGYGIADFFASATPNGGGAPWGNLGLEDPQDVNRDREHVYSISDDFTWSHGRHTLHFGVLTSQDQVNSADTGAGYLAGGKWIFAKNTNDSEECTGGGYDRISHCSQGSGGDPFAAFLEGVPTNLLFEDNLAPTYYYRWWNIGSYAQDDFKVLPNLTINVGIRHQYQSPRWEKNNRQGELAGVVPLQPSTFVIAYDSGLPAPIFDFAGYNGRSKYLDPPQYFDFEPRFGFSWSPTNRVEGHQVVIRGGYGITHDVLTGRSRTPYPNLAENSYTGFRSYSPQGGNDGEFNYTNVQGCGFATCRANLPGQFMYNNVSWLPDPNLLNIPSTGIITPIANSSPNGGDARYGNTGVVFDPTFKTPYIQNFSFQIQAQLSAMTSFTLGWQGAKGTKLFSNPHDINNNPLNGNYLVPGYYDGPGTNADAGMIILEDSTHSGSIYHALIANLDHRFSHDLQFNVNYTWGKSLDDASGGIEQDFNLVGGQDTSAQQIQGNEPQPSLGTTGERSLSAFNTPQVFNVTAFYELPFGHEKQFLNQGKAFDYVVGGWQISSLVHITSGQQTYVQLGDPQANRLCDPLGGNSDPCDGGGTIYNTRPNIVAGVPLKNPDWSPALANTVPYVNPRAFSVPSPGTFGNAPRTLGLNLPLAKRIDASVFKNLHVFENRQRYIELRAEFFNVFNWRSFGISGNGGSPVQELFSNNNSINQNDPAYEDSPSQPNRYLNLTPTVWDNFLKGSCPGSSGGISGAKGTVDSASTVCTELNSIYNSSFYILGGPSQNNLVEPRVIQFAAKLYF